MKIFKNIEPPKIIGFGFLLVIIIGTFLLSLPISSADGESINVIDALFTAASATCITGLSTVVTAEQWSFFGQIVILFLIQVGGLGFMAFVTMVFMVMGKRITLRDRIIIRESYNLDNGRGIVKFIRYICKFTFAVEALGAFFLSIRFIPRFGFLRGLYFGIFHSISAFCNAGFDVLGSNSLENFSGDYILMITIMILIITGGIGFPVFMDLYLAIKNIIIKKIRIKIALKSLKLHSKLALSVTSILIVLGAVFFFISEYSNTDTFGNMNLLQKILNSFFQSVTFRTAGFAAVDQGLLNDSSEIMALIFMFIGGSPASTAGGAKTVTVAVVILSVITLIKDEEQVVIFKRNIAFSTVRKALAVVITMIFMIFASAIILSITERNCPVECNGLDIFFEVVSAICTVGNTTGITPYLSQVGKIVIILCMYMGRIGPVTMAMIFTSHNKKTDINYPDGNVIVG